MPDGTTAGCALASHMRSGPSPEALLEQIDVVDKGSADAREAPRYLVELPFRAARNGRLTQAPHDLPDGARIERTVLPDAVVRDERQTVLETVRQTFGSDGSTVEAAATPAALADPERMTYRYCVTIRATNAEEAMAVAEAGANALLDAFAANQMAFELGARKERYIKRLDPPTDPVPDTDLPLDSVGIRTADPAAVARRYDPTGELRRKGKVFSSNADAVVDRPSVALEGELYAGRDRWDDRIRRAAEIYRLAQCSDDETVQFLLSCLALEVLVAHDRTPVLRALVSSKRERGQIVDTIDNALAARGLPENARARISERIQTTEAQGYTTSATAYVATLSFPIPAENLAWVQRERGGFVHAGTRHNSAEAAGRRNDFVKIVGVTLLREMAIAAGRGIDDLVPGTTFTGLQIWKLGGGDRLTLQPD